VESQQTRDLSDLEEGCLGPVSYTKAIGVDMGSGIDCGCWWLVVELQKWKVNELMI